MHALKMAHKYRFRWKRLRQLREARGWSETELAARAGVTAPAIRKWETGDNTPKLLTYLDLAAALGVDVLELVEPTGS